MFFLSRPSPSDGKCETALLWIAAWLSLVAVICVPYRFWSVSGLQRPVSRPGVITVCHPLPSPSPVDTRTGSATMQSHVPGSPRSASEPWSQCVRVAEKMVRSCWCAHIFTSDSFRGSRLAQTSGCVGPAIPGWLRPPAVRGSGHSRLAQSTGRAWVNGREH